jgi:decaprenylphospho-beta-D-ribofuranose 2-oxidase
VGELVKLSGWGRYPVIDARVCAPGDEDALRHVVISQPSVIARGNGRAYGDSAVNPSMTIDMRRFDRLLAFDPASGQLTAEAGVLLEDVISAFLPRGWFPPVTPGTKFVTLGGMIAADVHGKNHHKDGSFREFVDWIEVMGADGSTSRCARDESPGLFDHTLGGMGLSGPILRAAFRLRRVETAWICQKTIAAPDLNAAMAAFEGAQEATYSVAWVDCLGTGRDLGRSLVMLGEHAQVADLPARLAGRPFETPAKRKASVPLDLPSFALNQYSVRAFNALYYRLGARGPAQRLVDWDSYFYPLDTILGWNRIYGRRGFAQFQCVLPLAHSQAGLTALLEVIAATGAGSFLAVLKRFGPQSSAFSFPMEGYTLSLDFPVNPGSLALLERLDRITLAHEGRFYLAKDSRMSAATLHAADARADVFRRRREEAGWRDRFQSSQAERLSI